MNKSLSQELRRAIVRRTGNMQVRVMSFLRNSGIIPAGTYLRTDSFMLGRTQERRRPDRTDAVVVQRRYEDMKKR